MTSSQLSDALHILLHLAQGRASITSEALALGLGTNPVVLRRLMGGLRDAGLVKSVKGHRGGWRMAMSLDQVTLGQVHSALGAPTLVSLGFRQDRPECLVAKVVNESLQNVMQRAESALLEEFGRITLADLSLGIDQRLEANTTGTTKATYLLEDHHAQH